MRSLAQSVAVLGIAVVGAAIALFLQSKGLIPSKSGAITPFQVTGDPNVTVSDGSLHAHSVNGWTTNNPADKTIQPNPKSGSLGYTCNMQDSHGHATSASLWADDQIYDILPGAKVTIVHDHNNASGHDGTITITVPHAPPQSATDVLTIKTSEGTFDAPSGAANRYNREHSRRGEVESITIQNPSGSSQTWYPVNHNNPHFTVLFCYQ
jgi:hypothetical protein